MVHLKKKIRIVSSLPPEEKKKMDISGIIIALVFLIVLGLVGYFIYNKLLPYINATDINKIKGKKVFITTCNTKDYVIINKDKSFTMSLTNDNCTTKYYEGNITIKYNQITFTSKLKNEENKKEVIEVINGAIDAEYNIIINNNIFEAENEK